MPVLDNGRRRAAAVGCTIIVMVGCASASDQAGPGSPPTTSEATPATSRPTTTVHATAAPAREAPSQDRAAAARDGVVAALADLPVSVRVDEVRSASSDEGLWVLSRPISEALAMAPGCGLGDPNGVPGRDIICVVEYGEVVLMDPSGTVILRAFPLPGLPPQHLAVTDEAVFCGRQGDGGLPDSMLCRIDRATLEWTVRVFPSAIDSAFGQGQETVFIPDNWILDDPIDGVFFETMEVGDGGLVVEGSSGRRLVDASTLELHPAH